MTKETAETKSQGAAAEVRASYPTIWKAVEYGVVGSQVCRISEWVSFMPNGSPKKFTLHPIEGGSPHCGLTEGEFARYNDQENKAVRACLAAIHKNEDYEPVWRD